MEAKDGWLEMRLRRGEFSTRHFAISWGYHNPTSSPFHIGIYAGHKEARFGFLPYRMVAVAHWDWPVMVYGEAGWKSTEGFGLPIPQEAKQTWYGSVKTRWIERIAWRRGGYFRYD
jgi:hypothetical protein